MEGERFTTNTYNPRSMHGSTVDTSMECQGLASIVLAAALLVLGAAVQSAWTAWRSMIAEQHIDSADAETARRERKRTLSRQCPVRMGQGRLEPSSVLADKTWTSYAACHYPKHWDKTKCPTKTTTLVCNCDNPKTWAMYAADHHQKKSQTIHQVGRTHLPGFWCKSCVLLKRTLSSEHVAVTRCKIQHTQAKAQDLVCFRRKI